MQDPRIVSKHTDLLQKHIHYHCLDIKVNALYNMAKNNNWSALCTDAHEKMDKFFMEGILHSEKEVSRKFSRTFVWPPKLSRAVKTLHYWQLRLRLAQGHTFNWSKVTRLQYELGVDQKLLSIPTSEIVQNFRTSRHALKEYQQKHVELRDDHLKQLAEAHLLARNPSLVLHGKHKLLDKRVAKELHRMKRKEAQRVVHRRVCQALGPLLTA
jgi:hypothetical protein